MLKIPIEEIVKKIKEKTNLPEDVIYKKIDAKVEELSGLVSREGAAHIIAGELGVKLFDDNKSSRLRIKNILPGLKSVSIIARVLKKYPTRTYKTKDGKEGKITSLLVGDETGKIRIVFWDNSQIKAVEENVAEGDIIQITSCYVREGLNGLELHATKRSKMAVNPDIEDVKEIPKLDELMEKVQRVPISALDEGAFEIKGAIVSYFVSENPFFYVCPECGKKVEGDLCEVHGAIKPKRRMTFSLILDDGTGNIRVVFFGKQAEILTGLNSQEAYEDGLERGDFSAPIKEKLDELLGTEIIVDGKVSLNSYSGDLEMIANRVYFANPVLEAKELIKELE